MKETWIILTAILLVSIGNAADNSELIFKAEKLNSRHCTSSAVINTKYGKCLEAMPIMTGKPSYGELASISLRQRKIKLSPGLYRAVFKVDADIFVSHPRINNGFYYGISLPGGRWKINPLLGIAFSGNTGLQTFKIPFVVTEDPKSVPDTLIVGWFGNLGKILDAPVKVRTYSISMKKAPIECFIASSEADKILYSENATGKVECKIINSGKKTWTGKVVFEMISGIDTRRELGSESVTVSPGKTVKINKAFKTGSQQFGHEIQTKLIKDGKALQTVSTVFTVAKHFWDVALGAVNNGVLHGTGRDGGNVSQKIKDYIAQRRKNYSNWIEKDFWAPDDWGNLTPEKDKWISGQAARGENRDQIKELIKEAHKYGIKAITYGKGMAGGPSAWELLREKPDLFLRDKKTGRWGGNIDLWDLEHWNDFKANHYRKPYTSCWHRISPDLGKTKALDHGIRELIASAKMFGWDGVRFDGHFTAIDDTVSTYNMRRMKEQIWKEYPDYLFGFNMCSIFDRRNKIPHEEREAMAGGGHWMQEAIGSWRYDGDRKYKNWKFYAEHEQEASRKIQKLGGTYHYIFRLTNYNANEAVMYYKFIIGILNGAHPCYGAHEEAPGCKNWGHFLTRWGELFWHPNRKPINLGQSKIKGTKFPKNLLWKLWAKSIPVTQNTEYLVFPFLLLPDTELIKETTKYPSPLKGAELNLKNSPYLSRIEEISWLNSDSIEPKKLEINNGLIKLPVIRELGILVVKLKGCPDYRPIQRAKFTEKVSPEALKKSRASGQVIVVVDPLRPELNKAPEDDKVETQTAAECSWSMKRAVFDDPEASSGHAAGTDKKFGKCTTGQYFWTLRPGKYKITARLKAEPVGVKGVWSATMYENSQGKFKFDEKKTIRKSFSYDLINKGKYAEVVLTEEYQHYGMFFLAVFIATRIPQDAPENARFLLDWIRVERLEEYTDHDIAAKMKLPEKQKIKVGPLSDVLWVRGLYDPLYNLKTAVKTAFPKGKLVEKYQRDLPKTAEELAKFGTIIMPNVPVETMGIQTRKLYCDWVKSGGHLIILGGSFGLGQGLMQGTFFDDILPCEIQKNADLAKLPANSKLKQKKGFFSNLFGGGNVSDIYYAHVTKAKPDAEITASTGKIPLIMTIKSGKGRCTVFAGTVMGAKKNNPKAFWNNKKWTGILAKMIRY